MGGILKELFLIVGTIFLMEFADKTQLAAMCFATKYNPVTVYIGVISGLALATLISVALGKILCFVFPYRYLKIFVGIVFIGIGIWSIFGK
ncbi:MAG: TMEM165/GDT1 family protein [Candidatus Hydrothermales bacterium]